MNITSRELSVSDDSEVRLTLTVAGSSIRETYDGIVADLRRTARIKGFRRGKVPREVLIRKFGPALLAQTTDQVVNESVQQAVDEIEQKPLPLAQPALASEPDLVLDQDLTFTVTYDTTPQVVLGPYRGLALERPEVTVGEADLEPELQRLQEQNAEVEDKPADAGGVVAVANGDVVTVNYVEHDAAGQAITDSERRDFVFEVGTGYNVYQMDDELVGMARGAAKVITKSFPADYQYSHLAGRTVTFEVTVTSIKEKRLPDLDDELAQDVSDRFRTLADLKDDLRRRLQTDAERRVRDRLGVQILDQLMERSQVPLPKTLVAVQLEVEWRTFAARSGIPPERFEEALAARGQSKEAVLNLARPRVEERVRRRLVVEELIRVEGIEVSDEELDAHLAPQAEERGFTTPELRTRYENEKVLERVREQLGIDKLYDRLIAGSKVTPGAATSYVDLVSGNQ